MKNEMIEKILGIISDDDLADSISKDCHDKYHDDRWCQTCNSRLDGIDDYQREILSRISHLLRDLNYGE